ncbi:response regulator transcription factor [Anaerotruncus colihominis]|uniref:Heme response regulator HssR n=1 Tax=Anaerotruncus colihominis TaxID=169435 RepID=A0A845RCQ8_9FIRM|nr:response regulator transcription factor [Anaerotruncus colihominis]NBI77483.1 DNA-binding response regulator [Anaerotruncus colihominis]
MFSILVAEDDYSLRELMSDFLLDNGYQVCRAKDGAEALMLIERSHIDLMICDIMMPELDGYGLTRELREAGYDLPVIMVTARETLEDKHMGFLAGTDDYMVKPIDFEELLWRVSALLRRAQIASGHKLEIGGIKLDYDALSVTTEQGTDILPKKEFQLLFKLLNRPGKTFTRQQLMDDIWGLDSDADERTVDVHIKRLREKFGGFSQFKIVTVRGLGYRAEKLI